MVVETKKLTYEDYLAMPETNKRYEIIDGELIMTPSPTGEHQWISGNLYRALHSFVMSHNLGVVLYAPLDILITRHPSLRTRQPDILYLSGERLGAMGWQAIRHISPLEIAPDMVIEIISPGSTRRDMEEKVIDYKRIGVRECWLVSPEAQTVEVLKPSPEGIKLLDIFGSGMTIRSEVLEGSMLPVDDIFV